MISHDSECYPFLSAHILLSFFLSFCPFSFFCVLCCVPQTISAARTVASLSLEEHLTNKYDALSLEALDGLAGESLKTGLTMGLAMAVQHWNWALLLWWGAWVMDKSDDYSFEDFSIAYDSFPLIDQLTSPPIHQIHQSAVQLFNYCARIGFIRRFPRPPSLPPCLVSLPPPLPPWLRACT